jgi:hypothetical protein
LQAFSIWHFIIGAFKLFRAINLVLCSTRTAFFYLKWTIWNTCTFIGWWVRTYLSIKAKLRHWAHAVCISSCWAFRHTYSRVHSIVYAISILQASAKAWSSATYAWILRIQIATNHTTFTYLGIHIAALFTSLANS